jgi:hypothetical protein
MNARNMSIAPAGKAFIKHVDAFRSCPPFSYGSKFQVISTHNPWRRKALGWNLFEYVLRKHPDETTVGQIIKDAKDIGYDPHNTMRHLRWLYTWGDFITIDGVRYFPRIAGEEQVKEEQT